MKFILLLTLFLFSSAFSQKAPNIDEVLLMCSENMSSVVEIKKLENKNLKLTVYWANGSTPMTSDPSSGSRLNDLVSLNKKEALYKNLEDGFSVELDQNPDKCKEEPNGTGEYWWSCYTKKPGQIRDLKYKDFGFRIYTQTVKSFFSEHKIINFSINFGVALKETKKASLIQNHTLTIGFENSISDDVTKCFGTAIGLPHPAVY